MQKDYGAPLLLCDLIMKGGIASGVIYPLTVCTLAEIYQFANIGGTSAGAIAAAAAGAAECGRRNQAVGGFDKFSQLPEWIGSNSRLLNMFQPDSATAPVFHMAMAFLNQKTTLGKVTAALRTAALRYPLISLLGILPGAFIGTIAIRRESGIFMLLTLVCSLILVLCGLVVALGFRFYQLLAKTVPGNFYGLSKAYDPTVAVNPDTEGPLTNWLSAYLNGLAGLEPTGRPLTFGDLYNARKTPQQAGLPAETPAINLEMMTTALNLGRPFRLPFHDPDQIFYFLPDEFEQLFPKTVVQYMLDHEPDRRGKRPVTADGKKLFAVPAPENMPVVVATRMSLSFPLLISAVPLYAVDYTLERNHGDNPIADRCWFSDGGESSNLPIHFFDAPVPRWPTFAIDLKAFHPDHQSEADAVYLPKAGRPVQPEWVRFEQPGAFGSLFGFFGAIINAMQTWQDTLQARLPGVRDRIVHVSQRPSEGGLNIDMDKETILRLSDRGRRAGVALVESFGIPNAQRWKEHRWARLLAALSGTEDWLRHFGLGYYHPLAPDVLLSTYVAGPVVDGPITYPIPPPIRSNFAASAERIADLADKLQEESVLSDRSPKPEPELRLRSRI